MRARAPQSPALTRYEQIARIVTGRPQANADDLVGWLSELVRDLHVPRLGAYGVTESDAPAIVAAAAKASSMKANPVVLTSDECAEIVREAV